MGSAVTEPTSSSPPGDTTALAADWHGSDAVYAATYRHLLRIAFLITGSAPTAEDVVHDVMCSVGPRMSTLEDPAVYLRVAVVNRCRSLHRRTQRAPSAALQVDLRIDAQLDPGLTELRDELGRLPVKQRSAIVLRYLCDLPDADIAATLGCRNATVRSLVHRGLAELRRTLSKVTP